MIRQNDRRLFYLMFKLGLFKSHNFMWISRLRPRGRVSRWLYNWMLRRQVRDGLHHAPACPGNEWAGVELVFRHCNCGAVAELGGSR